MPNTLSGLYTTAIKSDGLLQGIQRTNRNRHALLRAVSKDEPETNVVAKTIQINIPSVNPGNVSNIGNGAVRFSPTSHTTVTVPLDTKPSDAKIIKYYDQTLTTENLQRLYMAPMLEEVLQYIDACLMALVTSTNFNSYSTITGGDDVFTRTNLATFAEKLETAGVPPEGIYFLTHSHVYFTMLNDSSLVKEDVVGIDAAKLSTTAQFMPQFGMILDRDQAFPQPSTGVYAALAFNPLAISMRFAMETTPEGSPVKRLATELIPGVPAMWEMWDEPREQGVAIHLKSLFGYAVTRPDWGVYGVTT